MIILYYDTKEMKSEELQQAVETLRDVSEDNVVAVPKQFDVLLNASLDQLMMVRTIIDTAMAEMIKAQMPNNAPLPKVELEEESNIIKLDKYLH